MRFIKEILLVAWILWIPLMVRAADAPLAERAAAAAPAGQVAEPGQAEAEHGLPANAVKIKPGGFINNSMIVSWAVAAFLILFARHAMKNVQDVPAGAQNFWEWLVESLYVFLEDIIGADLVKRTFWFFATVFIFILCANWAGLVPGVGTIGWGRPDADGHLHHITRPLFRGVNADLNMTFAMAIIFFACWIVWAVQANGPGGFIMHLFGPKGETTGLLKLLMIGIFIIVGLLEVITILFRPITLSFRLYGNIFAGENMLEAMSNLIKEPSWMKAVASAVIPIPFYFLELLVGLVQALVFMLLTAVFTLLICAHEEEHVAGRGHEKARH